MTKKLGVTENEIPTDVRYAKFLEGFEKTKDKECHLAPMKPTSMFNSELFIGL